MSTPDWLDGTAYPFPSSYFDTGEGRLHYLDVGTGPAVVLIHGTPTWSFVYRHIITDLQADHRVIAPDLLGFGLSDKPGTEAVAPRRQAEHIQSLLNSLQLSSFHLIVHDFGGPIGLSYALGRPECVDRITLFNTWMWPLTDTMTRWASSFFGTTLGRWVYTRRNFSTDVLLPRLTHQSLPPAIHAHYQKPFPTPESRHATWVFARDLTAADDWYKTLWSKRDRLRSIPTQILWGEQDPGFGAEARTRWETVLDPVQTRVFSQAGHLPQEEVPDAVRTSVRTFAEATPTT